MVCLGNICRSPLAQGILEGKVEEKGIEAEVDSCGTSSWHVGEPPDERMQQEATAHGINLSHMRARQFTIDDFDDFDKIFVMDTSNYENVLALARDENDRQKVDLMLNVSLPGSHKSVPDPYFGGGAGFQKVYELLDEACEKFAQSLV